MIFAESKCHSLPNAVMLPACILSTADMDFFFRCTVSQVANQTVPRQIRFVTVETTDFGVALGDVDSGADTSNLYGTGARDGDNSGLRCVCILT